MTSVFTAWKQRLNTKAVPRGNTMAIRKTINKIFLSLYHWYLPEIGLFILSSGLYLYNAFRYSFPTGYAGLYTLMAEQLGENSFKIPRIVPYYGPGGFPYAYPSAGFYLAAFIHQIFHIPWFTYLRFAPPLLTLLFLALDYIFIHKITSSRIKAILGTALTITAGAVYEYQVQAAGMVRSLALVFAMLALIFSWDAFSTGHSLRSTYLRAALAGLTLGLTVLSHLSYALFAMLGILVFGLLAQQPNWRIRLALSAVIFGGGFLVSSAWWGTVLARFGLTVLTNPARSHGNFEVVHALLVVGLRRMPFLFVQKLIGVTYTWAPAALVGLIASGLVYLILRRKWALLVWFLLVFLAVGEPERFLLIIGCIATAELLGGVLDFVSAQDAGDHHTNLPLYVIAVCILFALPVYNATKTVLSDTPTLTSSLIEASNWVKDRTPPVSTYLLLDDNNDLDEWVPYLTRRTPLVGSWGGEWVGNLTSLDDLSSRLDACVSAQSYPCLQELILQKNLQVSWLISLTNRPSLNTQIGADPAWQLVFKNDQFLVFGRK
jgi:hypothetical protein